MKSFVRKRSHPEGSITEGYIMLEYHTFCSRYLHDMKTKFTRHMSSVMHDSTTGIDEGLPIFHVVEKSLGGPFMRELTDTE